MFNTEFDYSNNNLIFNYINLNKYLCQLYTKGIDNINILLLISLEKEYYNDKNLKRIIKDLVKLKRFGSINEKLQQGFYSKINLGLGKL